jgi:hypothetical protein
MNNIFYWAGLGSRHELTETVRVQQDSIGKVMTSKGWVLVTGGAAGSDFNFLRGASHQRGKYLPIVVRPIRYKNYKGIYSYQSVIEMMEQADFERAKAYFFKHKIFTEDQFNSMPDVGQKLHARNFFQIFDHLGKVRVRFVAYAAPEDRWGNVSGGTRTAVAIARIEKLPVFNIKLKGQYKALQDFIEGLPNASN